jgi:hypothetical protein
LCPPDTDPEDETDSPSSSWIAGYRVLRESKDLGRGRCSTPVGPASEAYCSPYFVKNKLYTQTFGEQWCILSAKYGLVLSGEEVENYDFTFRHHHRDLVTPAQLHGQIAAKQLHPVQRVQVLGGREYVNRARTAFARYSLAIEAPLAGLRIGESMQAVQEAVDSGRPLA